jgi:hypothetical protein
MEYILTLTMDDYIVKNNNYDDYDLIRCLKYILIKDKNIINNKDSIGNIIFGILVRDSSYYRLQVNINILMDYIFSNDTDRLNEIKKEIRLSILRNDSKKVIRDSYYEIYNMMKLNKRSDIHVINPIQYNEDISNILKNISEVMNINIEQLFNIDSDVKHLAMIFNIIYYDRLNCRCDLDNIIDVYDLILRCKRLYILDTLHLIIQMTMIENNIYDPTNKINNYKMTSDIDLLLGINGTNEISNIPYMKHYLPLIIF